ncbi:MAG: hypothetical protein WBQ75_12530 [Acetobacteraceae bacterium]
MLLVAAHGSFVPLPLPLPPTPPVGGPPGHIAPTPDLFARQPTDFPLSEQPSFAPAWLASRPVQQSQGFVPGSQVDARPNGHTEYAPGVSFSMPLH